jgi:branched-chain amino acid transport system permease protein
VPFRVPAILDGPLFTLYSTSFPKLRGFMMLVALIMLLSIYLVLTRTRHRPRDPGGAHASADGRGARPQRAARVSCSSSAAGCALAGLAGVIGGVAFVTEPSMAASVGPIVFVVAW